jgi:ABC-type phosphate/phosphonate transport system permease subunit
LNRSSPGCASSRWDINIRESTVLGLVGVGGIGFALNEAILGLGGAGSGSSCS